MGEWERRERDGKREGGREVKVLLRERQGVVQGHTKVLCTLGRSAVMLSTVKERSWSGRPRDIPLNVLTDT